jgi:hypothetical protein
LTALKPAREDEPRGVERVALSSGVLRHRRSPVFFALGLLGGFLPPYADRTGLWVLDGDAVRWAGVALFARAAR